VISWLSLRAALVVLIFWFGLAAALIVALATRTAAVLFVLALSLVTYVALRTSVPISLAAALAAGLAFAAVQLATGLDVVVIGFGAAPAVDDLAAATAAGPGTWGPALLGGVLLLLAAPVAKLTESRYASQR
jgi:hypothetical protein